MAVNNPRPFLISDRLALFPDTTRIHDDSLKIAGHPLTSLANQFGTPLYIYERATMDAALGAYQGALRAYYPAHSEVTYAGKAFLCTSIVQWTQGHKLWVDSTGEAEIRIAVAGGAARARILVHGVNKSMADLTTAAECAGTIVVDNLTELRRIRDLVPTFTSRVPNLWLRLQPGLAVRTHHAHTQTGQSQSKFGMTPNEIMEAAALCKRQGLPLKGLHFHQGSNFRDPSPLIPAISLALDLVREIGIGDRWHFCPGGGWGAAYHEDELPQPEIEDYVRIISHTVRTECKKRGLALPFLHLEPGRSLIARAGIAIYRVGTVKRRGRKTWLLIDGGMADNPRPALYGTKYSALPVEGVSRELTDRVNIAGPYCESGDVLIQELLMPKIEEGELIAIPVSGAYHLSMSSNYNGAQRPAVLWLEEESARLIVRREKAEELSRRDSSVL